MLYVYILKCNDGKYYTGVTNDLDTRLQQHQEGENPTAYTFHRRPVELVFYEMVHGENQAIALEKKIKGWSRAKKEALIERNWSRIQELAKCNNETSHLNFRKGS